MAKDLESIQNFSFSLNDTEIKVEKVKKGDSWVSKKPEIEFEITRNEDIKIKKYDKSIINEDDLIEAIREGYVDALKRSIESRMSGVEETDESGDPNSKPYNADQIRIDPKDFSINDVCDKISKNKIDLSPDFQRYFVWKEIKKQSRLIESILLRIPLPIFYLSQDKDGTYQIVDGLQRLSVIKKFKDNQLVLKELEYLKDDCDKKTYDELELKYQNRFDDTQLKFYVIDSSTPSNVKYEVFKRLNQGGKPLNPQEIRNCTAKKHTRDLLRILSMGKEFINATLGDVSKVRMLNHEFIIRFIAFYSSEIMKIDLNEKQKYQYKGDMDLFLDDCLDLLNQKKIDERQVTEAFKNAMINCQYLFEDHAFRKISAKDPSYKLPINKSLFSVWSVLLSQFQPEKIKKKYPKSHLVQPFANKLQTDIEYEKAISYGTNQTSKIKKGFEVANEIILKELSNA